MIYLSIGSNLGDKKKNLEKAKYLINLKNIDIVCSSSIYKTASWPDTNFPDYLNIVIKVNTKLNLIELFKCLKKIEKELGRKKTPKNYPRQCDIDIIDFNGLNIKKTVDDQAIIVPHPRMINRNFVLFPLFEIDKNWIHPKNGHKVSYLISNLEIKQIRSIKIL